MSLLVICAPAVCLAGELSAVHRAHTLRQLLNPVLVSQTQHRIAMCYVPTEVISYGLLILWWITLYLTFVVVAVTQWQFFEAVLHLPNPLWMLLFSLF